MNITDKIEEVEYVLYEIKKLVNHQIPYYAYGDNEAACQMASRMDDIGQHIHNLENILGVKV